MRTLALLTMQERDRTGGVHFTRCNGKRIDEQTKKLTPRCEPPFGLIYQTSAETRADSGVKVHMRLMKCAYLNVSSIRISKYHLNN